MNDQKNGKKRRKKWKYIIIAIVVILGGVEAVRFVASKPPQQDIYFTEYNLKVDTTILKYDSVKNETSKIGVVDGEFYKCVLNSDKTCITGLLYDSGEKKTELVRYDLSTGTLEDKGLAKIMKDTADADEWENILIYDGGNKFLVSYLDGNEEEKWLFYDIATGQYGIVEGEHNGTCEFVEIHDNILWYVAKKGCTLYQYNLETQEKTKIMDSVEGVAVNEDAGLVAYAKEKWDSKIYLYDIKHKITRLMAIAPKWYSFYADLFYTESRWSDDGRLLFYVKIFPGFAATSDVGIRACDPKSGRVFSIYEIKNTGHTFRFIASD